MAVGLATFLPEKVVRLGYSQYLNYGLVLIRNLNVCSPNGKRTGGAVQLRYEKVSDNNALGHNGLGGFS